MSKDLEQFSGSLNTHDAAIVQELVARQIDLMRYERSIRADVVAKLENLERLIIRQLQGGLQGDLSKRELNTLLADVRELLNRDYDLFTHKTAEENNALLLLELAFLGALIEDISGKPYKPIPQTAQNEMTADKLLVGGFTLGEAFARQKQALSDRLTSAARLAVLNGDAAGIADDVRMAFKRAKQSAVTTIATWLPALSNRAVLAVGKVNPLVKGWRHVSVLDSKTSAVCTFRNGLLWDKNHQGIQHNEPFRVPPLHPHCRSRLVWVTDIHAEFQALSGDDWVKSRSLEQLQEQFGKGIGQLLHNGDVALKDVLKSGGLVPMTLQELLEKHTIPETVFKIRMKDNWSDAYRRKMENMYYLFANEGIKLSIHSVSRLQRLNRKGFIELDVQDVIAMLKGLPNYRQDDTVNVYFSEKKQLAVFVSNKDNQVITFVRRKKGKDEWKQYT